MRTIRQANSSVPRGARALLASAVLAALTLAPSITAGASGSSAAGTAGALHPKAATGQITAHDGKFWLNGQVLRMKGFDHTAGIMPSSDYQRMAGWGTNVIRLLVHWAFLEPTHPTKNPDGTWKHTYDSTGYLQTVLTDVSTASQYGIYTIVDNHPCTPDVDTGCPYFSYPDWEYQAAYNSHGITYTQDDAGVAQAQADYWTDSLREQFQTDEEVYLAKQLLGKPGVLGYEIQNEPQSGNLALTHDTTQLMLGVMLNTAKAVRVADPSRTILFATRFGYGPGLQQADLSGWVNLAGTPVGNTAFDLHDYFGGRWGDGILENPGNTQYGELTSILFDHVDENQGPYIGTTFSQIRFLQQALSRLKGMPLIIGELGDNTMDPGVYVYYGTVLSAVQSTGVSWVGWYSGPLGITNPDDSLEPFAYLVINAMGS